MNQKTALAIIIALFIVFVLAYFSFAGLRTGYFGGSATSTLENGTPISIQGEYVCLPLRSATASSTLDCTLGVKTDNSVYYAIDATGDAAKNTLLSLQTGLKIQIDGTLVPSSQVSSDVWQKYDIGGVVSTNSIKRI